MSDEVDVDARNAALIEFIGSFSTVSEHIDQISDLGDGVAIFEALSEMYVSGSLACMSHLRPLATASHSRELLSKLSRLVLLRS
jgi:hypothetical protein